MIIDFNEIQEVANPQFKGGEGDTMFRTYNDGQNKIMCGRLEPGCSIGYHSHETNSEIIYILGGEPDACMTTARSVSSPASATTAPRVTVTPLSTPAPPSRCCSSPWYRNKYPDDLSGAI